MVKKILKIVGIVLLLLIVAAFTVPYVFKDQIKAKISQTINKSVDATVSFKEADLSMFKNFPNATIAIQKLAIINKAPFKGDTLVAMEELNLKMSLMELFNDENEPMNIQGISTKNGVSVVKTSKNIYETKLVVNCAGLYSDKVGQMTDERANNLRITPFRGEYFEIKPEKQYLVKNLIYPVPDPNFPFLGVHFTRMIHGGVEAGPNAVLAFRREGYKKLDIHFGELFETLAWPGFRKVAAKYWQTGLGEMYRSFSKAAFTKALQELIPEIQSDDLVAGAAGVRAQACDREGGLVDDFAIYENQQAINVCNAPSPAATSSLSIGQTVSELVLKRF